MPSRSAESRADLVNKLASKGETVSPQSTMMQIKARLCELQEQDTNHNGKVLKKLMTELNKAARKKSDLIAYCQEHQVRGVTPHMTIAQMFAKAQERLTMQTAHHGSNPVSFGKYGHLPNQELKDNHPDYAKWVITTSREEDSPDWRLTRLAQWVQQAEEAEKPVMPVKAIHKQSSPTTTYGPTARGKPSSHHSQSESDGHFSVVNEGEPSVSQLLAEIQSLKDENADLVRQ